MPRATDYRDSHKHPDKGVSYARDFQQRNYRTYIWAWEQQVLQDVLRRFGLDRREIDYMDFACGTGRIIGFLEGRVTSSLGVDVSDSMLDVARRNLSRSKLLKADITQGDPLGEQRFDLITAFRFFLNAQPLLRQQALGALARLLKPQGLLVLNSHMNHTCLLARLVRAKRRLLGRDPGALVTLGRREVQRLADDAALRIVRTYHRGMVPVVDESSTLPTWPIWPLDSVASRLPALEPLSRYVVYVCQAASAAGRATQ